MLDAGMRDDRWMYRVGSSDVSNVEEAEPRICFSPIYDFDTEKYDIVVVKMIG